MMANQKESMMKREVVTLQGLIGGDECYLMFNWSSGEIIEVIECCDEHDALSTYSEELKKCCVPLAEVGIICLDELTTYRIAKVVTYQHEKL
jgi:hypothetical protein